jgi:hypothetical protein
MVPADLVFLIAAPAGAAEAHLAVLSKLARSLMQDDFTAGLRAATSADEVVAIVRNAIGEGDAAPAVAPAAADAAPTTAAGRRRAQRRGTTGPHRGGHRMCDGHRPHVHGGRRAHRRGQEAGIDLVVEPQGSSGYKALPQRDRQRGRRDLRHRRRRSRARALRRQAGDPLRRQARHRAARPDDPRGRRRANDPSSAASAVTADRRDRDGGHADSRGVRASSGSCSPV